MHCSALKSISSTPGTMSMNCRTAGTANALVIFLSTISCSISTGFTSFIR